MKNHLLLHYCLFFVTAILWGHDAHAACSFDQPINQSFKGGLHAEHPVTECLKEGEDPLKGYLRNEGNAFSRTKYHAILPRSVRAASALPNAYKEQACDPRKKKAGGKSSEGATNPCMEGPSKSLTSIPPQKVNVPICEDCTDCGVGLLGALIGAVTGGGGMPDLSSTFSAAGNISRNGCVGGSIGICGLGTIGGSVCPSSLISANGMQPPSAVTTRSNRAQSANTNPSYIRVNAPSLQIASPKTQLHNGTTNYVPDGGLLRVCSGTMGTCYDVVVPPNGHVVIDGEGVLRVGCPTCPAPSGERIIGRAGGTSENNSNNNGNLGLMNLDGRPVAGSGADFSSLRNNNNNSNNNSSLAFDLNADDFTVTVTPTANMSGESVVLADENLVQGSGPRGINSLTSTVNTINVNSEPNGNGEQRRPVTEVVDVGVNTRLPTDRTLETLRDADVPEGTCPDGGTSCFVGSFAPLAPTENEMPSDIDQPYNNETLTILE
ncbi:MAG: hypothetical protein EAZ74_02970 [Alphaproteobacteria bacterium]|nr:MAG: hypothetical protein EAY76_04610 [Alphaproteobacteria bacterium]TAF14866.1 MAG: hypothetical protein EAZ74_02970 [Alphaproteobacteria bacterium]TAF75382.1 MAG: hypothetical protein EAZ52_06780 [Alphaproteobacteria bacterium]